MQAYILLHGKLSGPSATECAMNSLHQQLQQKNHIVDFVDYAWSSTKMYDAVFENSLNEIDAAVHRVKALGATQIHLVGHSMGANVLMYYATMRDTFDSLILLCPAHNTHMPRFKEITLWSIDQAKKQLSLGNDTVQPFVDFNWRHVEVHHFKPSVYLSYFDGVNGNCNMVKNAKKFRPDTHVLVIAGELDIATENLEDIIYKHIVKSAKSKFMVLAGETHVNVPGAALSHIESWLATL